MKVNETVTRRLSSSSVGAPFFFDANVTDGRTDLYVNSKLVMQSARREALEQLRDFLNHVLDAIA